MRWLWFVPVAVVLVTTVAARWAASVAVRRADALEAPIARLAADRAELTAVRRSLDATGDRFGEPR